MGEVRRILALGKLHPTIFKHLAADRMSLASALVYARCEDPRRQFAVFKSVGKNASTSEYVIRDRLSETRLELTSPRLRFATLAAYKGRGGAFESDLLSGTAYAIDLPLVEALIDERFEKVTGRHRRKGWAWITAARRSEINPSAFADAPCLPNEPTAEQAATLDKLRSSLATVTALIGEMESADPESDSDVESTDLDDLVEQQMDLTEEIRAVERIGRTSGGRFSDAVRALSGVIITFDHAGQLSVFEGKQTPEEVKELARARRAAVKSGDDAGDLGALIESRTDPVEKKGNPGAFERDLGKYRRGVVRATLAEPRNAASAANLLHFELCRSAFGRRYHPKLLAISTGYVSDETTRNDATESMAQAALVKLRDALDIGWIEHPTGEAQWAGWNALSEGERATQVGIAVATQLTGGDRSDPNVGVMPSALTEMLGIDAASLWRPTRDNYFARLKSDEALALIREIYEEEFSERHRKTTKAMRVDALVRIFEANVETLSDAERVFRDTYVPASIAP